MSGRPSFSPFVYAYLWLCLATICGAPFLYLGATYEHPWPSGQVLYASIEAAGIGMLWLLAGLRCNSKEFPYLQGLLYVVAFMETGWSYFSLLLILPSLVVTLVVSVAAALWSSLPGVGAPKAAYAFRAVVRFFYRFRAIQ
jgi:hypothetical protein